MVVYAGGVLSVQEAAAYGGSVSQADLERFFYLDDRDMDLMAAGDHNRLGFSFQLATVRFSAGSWRIRWTGCRPTEVMTPPVFSESADNVHYVKCGLLPPPVELHRCRQRELANDPWLDRARDGPGARKAPGRSGAPSTWLTRER